MKSACKALNLEPDTVDWQASWSTKNDDYNKGELSIGSWVVFAEGKVDPLPIMENLLRGGQVGGLGDRVEKPLYPGSTDEDAYALYELRDLSSDSFVGLENFLTKIEKQVKNWHHNPPKYEELKNNLNTRALGAFCKKPNDDKKCKDNEVENAQGKCEACKSGEKPDPLKTKCISEKDDKPNDKPADNNDDDKRFREKKEGKWEHLDRRQRSA
ncbi:hypothetical protein BKA66DRAFT_457723 [Pyrenochaeta sp. MPI-SDFR-AT-0127]|nr:hypothetical protein BKA66DRAFT_457723 [Pyrenochaeta sp. MPI-SDFR-AT-0127]